MEKMKTFDMYDAEKMMRGKAYVAGDFDPMARLMRKFTGDDDYAKHSYLGVKSSKRKWKGKKGRM